MQTYKAPLDDMKFWSFDVFSYEKTYAAMPDFADMGPQLLSSVMEEMAKFAENEFLPANKTGDQEGCHYDADTRSVKVPSSYHQPFTRFVEAGWPSLSAPAEHGGQGLPHLLNVMLDEMCASTNTSLGMYFGLTHGAIVALSKHANKSLQDAYLTPLITGQWTGTMCLTEPQCGTDLGMIRTRAVPVDGEDNLYSINGSKIWITGGEHDLAENIIHLVLAKLPDAPAGTKGISLFLVPKFMPDGSRNGIYCTGLEHKMGILGSATCFMSLEGAKGWLIGEPHQGLSYMFSMMNTARIMVGVQGLGLGETAYQTALSFARERIQGRALSGVKSPEKEADGILVHPDVRRMLLSQKVMLDGCRALAYYVGMNLDVATHHPDEAQRTIANDRVELLTPIVKAFLTDQGYLAVDSAVQTLGGSGFTKDWGIEQLLRDCRIARIYEGTNGIQALDLVGRKIPMHGGRALRQLLADVQGFIEQTPDDNVKSQLRTAVGHVQEAVGWLMMNAMVDREQAGAAATPLLKLFGLVVVGYLIAQGAHVATEKLAAGDTRKEFLNAKVLARDFYFAEYLVGTTALLATIKAGKAHLMAFSESQL